MKEKKTAWVAIIIVIICTVFTSAGQIFLKLGTREITGIWSYVNSMVIIGFALYFFGALLLIVALKYGELSVLYPIIAMTFIWVSLLSVSILGESMNAMKWIGVMVIVIGVSFIGVGGR
ncbi:TPA: hypothetical protein HA361_06910 [Candidatus Woesearchaeota archaeon]|nr:hypothetical protein [Candidatus Woesearchaeota archaeon]HII69174.1 hypothetical protein [Candidatus Woesearchaeota archaeon]